MKTFNFYRLKLVKEKEVHYETLDSAQGAADFARQLIGDEPEENFLVVGLNTKGHAICGFTVSIGDVCSSIVHPREVFKRLVLANASACICFHNHPSGSLYFSKEDCITHDRLKEAGLLLGIQLLDHILVTDSGFASARREGLL